MGWGTYARVCICVWRCTHPFIWIKRQEINISDLPRLFSTWLLFKTGSLIESGRSLAEQHCLVNEPLDLPMCSPAVLGLHASKAPLGFLCRSWESKFRSSHLHSKHFTHSPTFPLLQSFRFFIVYISVSDLHFWTISDENPVKAMNLRKGEMHSAVFLFIHPFTQLFSQSVNMAPYSIA